MRKIISLQEAIQYQKEEFSTQEDMWEAEKEYDKEGIRYYEDSSDSSGCTLMVEKKRNSEMTPEEKQGSFSFSSLKKYNLVGKYFVVAFNRDDVKTNRHNKDIRFYNRKEDALKQQKAIQKRSGEFVNVIEFSVTKEFLKLS